MTRCYGTWGELRCERPLGHEGACHAINTAWSLGRNIVVNLDGPATATASPPRTPGRNDEEQP